MRTHFVLAAAFAVALGACDPSDATEPDAGAPPVEDAGPPGADAGPDIDPTAARFAEASPDGEGPWERWGAQVAAIDGSTAIVFGGTDAGAAGGTVFDDAWRVTFEEGGAVRATRIDATGPAPRYCGCITWDASRERVVVFGGRDLSGPSLVAQTWELDPAAAVWTEVPGATQPPGTIGCAMAYSPAAGSVFLFGGGGEAGFDDTTFRYDPAGGAWIELDASGPVARYDAAFVVAHDEASLLLFGGAYGARGAAFYSDLWRFDPTAERWSEIELPEGPAGRRIPWVVLDPDRAGLYVGFGFDGEMQALGDFHYADLDARTWTAIEIPFEGPVPRGFAPALPGGPDALGTVLGGNGGTRAVVDAWRLVR